MAEEAKFHQTMNETYGLIDPALGMVNTDLSDILLANGEQDFEKVYGT
ncbi:hypothetical protein [Pelagibius sp. Alg239-R121]|nr:hypothetical protein [Pelagibius sp. Alg239-R121]